MKICCTCKVEQSLTEFYASTTAKDGRQRQCKSCKKASNKSEHNKERCKRYRKQNPEKSKKSSKVWRENNAEYSINYYHKHQDKQKFYDSSARYIRERYKVDFNYRTMKKLKSQIWSYLKGVCKKGRTMDLLGYTVEDFILAKGNGEIDQQIDHKIPITWFQEDAPVSLIWHLDNLQWLDKNHNQSKGNRYADAVTEEYYLLVAPYLKNSIFI